jgi:uncharacterized membrane protein YfcA
MDQSIKAGIAGFSLAVIINLFLPVSLPIYVEFAPSFLAAIIAIFIFKIGTFKDGLVATLMTYFLNDAIVNSVGLAVYYVESKQYTLVVDASAVLSPIIEAVTAIIAAYIGARLVQSMKPPKESLSPLTVHPPSL